MRKSNKRILGLMMLFVLLMIPLNTAIAITIKDNKVVLTQKEAIELAKQIETYKAKIDKLQRLKDMLENELATERKFNKAEIKQLQDIIDELKQQINDYKKVVRDLKTQIERIKVKNEVNTWLNRLGFLLLGFLIGQVVNK